MIDKNGKVSDEHNMKLSATYEAEQKQLENRVAELDTYIRDTKEKSLNANSNGRRKNGIAAVNDYAIFSRDC